MWRSAVDRILPFLFSKLWPFAHAHCKRKGKIRSTADLRTVPYIRLREPKFGLRIPWFYLLGDFFNLTSTKKYKNQLFNITLLTTTPGSMLQHSRDSIVCDIPIHMPAGWNTSRVKYFSFGANLFSAYTTRSRYGLFSFTGSYNIRKTINKMVYMCSLSFTLFQTLLSAYERRKAMGQNLSF